MIYLIIVIIAIMTLAVLAVFGVFDLLPGGSMADAIMKQKRKEKADD